MAERSNVERRSWARQAGAVVQGVALGAALVWALLELAVSAAGGQVFRYQGF